MAVAIALSVLGCFIASLPSLLEGIFVRHSFNSWFPYGSMRKVKDPSVTDDMFVATNNFKLRICMVVDPYEETERHVKDFQRLL